LRLARATLWALDWSLISGAFPVRAARLKCALVAPPALPRGANGTPPPLCRSPSRIAAVNATIHIMVIFFYELLLQAGRSLASG
jgi:hypothetical protein